MIQTLRITGVAAVAFAALVLASVLGPVSLIHLDNTGDQRMGKVLAAPGAVDRFQEMHGDKHLGGQDTTPPLVRQAEAFKTILDPPAPVGEPPKQEVATARSPGPIVKPLGDISAKFRLIGTSYVPSNPNASFAYIFVDNAYKWVQCGEEVGHFVIKEVRADSVVCWDGKSESEIPREITPDRVSLLELDGSEQESAAAAASQPVEVKVAKPASTRPQPAKRSIRPQMPRATPKTTNDKRDALAELADRIRTIQGASGDANSATEAERAAALEKVMSEFKSSQVSPEETRKLEDLGREPNDGGPRAIEEKNLELMKRLRGGRTTRN